MAEIKNVTVVGAGTMGSQIALQTAMAGPYVVTLVDAVPGQLERARKFFPDKDAIAISFLSRAQYRSAWRRALKLHVEGTLWPPQSKYARSPSGR